MTARVWDCIDDPPEPVDHPPVVDEIGFRWDYDPASREWVSAEGFMSYPWHGALTEAGGFREIATDKKEQAA